MVVDDRYKKKGPTQAGHLFVLVNQLCYLYLILFLFKKIRFTAKNSTVSAVVAVGASSSVRIEWQPSQDVTDGRYHFEFNDEEYSSRTAIGAASARASIIAASSSTRTWFVLFSRSDT